MKYVTVPDLFKLERLVQRGWASAEDELFLIEHLEGLVFAAKKGFTLAHLLRDLVKHVQYLDTLSSNGSSALDATLAKIGPELQEFFTVVNSFAPAQYG